MSVFELWRSSVVLAFILFIDAKNVQGLLRKGNALEKSATSNEPDNRGARFERHIPGYPAAYEKNPEFAGIPDHIFEKYFQDILAREFAKEFKARHQRKLNATPDPLGNTGRFPASRNFGTTKPKEKYPYGYQLAPDHQTLYLPESSNLVRRRTHSDKMRSNSQTSNNNPMIFGSPFKPKKPLESRTYEPVDWQKGQLISQLMPKTDLGPEKKLFGVSAQARRQVTYPFPTKVDSKRASSGSKLSPFGKSLLSSRNNQPFRYYNSMHRDNSRMSSFSPAQTFNQRNNNFELADKIRQRNHAIKTAALRRNQDLKYGGNQNDFDSQYDNEMFRPNRQISYNGRDRPYGFPIRSIPQRYSNFRKRSSIFSLPEPSNTGFWGEDDVAPFDMSGDRYKRNSNQFQQNFPYEQDSGPMEPVPEYHPQAPDTSAVNFNGDREPTVITFRSGSVQDMPEDFRTSLIQVLKREGMGDDPNLPMEKILKSQIRIERADTSGDEALKGIGTLVNDNDTIFIGPTEPEPASTYDSSDDALVFPQLPFPWLIQPEEVFPISITESSADYDRSDEYWKKMAEDVSDSAITPETEKITEEPVQLQKSKTSAEDEGWSEVDIESTSTSARRTATALEDLLNSKPKVASKVDISLLEDKMFESHKGLLPTKPKDLADHKPLFDISPDSTEFEALFTTPKIVSQPNPPVSPVSNKPNFSTSSKVHMFQGPFQPVGELPISSGHQKFFGQHTPDAADDSDNSKSLVSGDSRDPKQDSITLTASTPVPDAFLQKFQTPTRPMFEDDDGFMLEDDDDTKFVSSDGEEAEEPEFQSSTTGNITELETESKDSSSQEATTIALHDTTTLVPKSGIFLQLASETDAQAKENQMKELLNSFPRDELVPVLDSEETDQNKEEPKLGQPVSSSRKIKRSQEGGMENDPRSMTLSMMDGDSRVFGEKSPSAKRRSFPCSVNTRAGRNACQTICKQERMSVMCAGPYCNCFQSTRDESADAEQNSGKCGPNTNFGRTNCRAMCNGVDDLITCSEVNCYCNRHKNVDKGNPRIDGMGRITTSVLGEFFYCGPANGINECSDICRGWGHVSCGELSCYCDRGGS